MRLTAKQQKQRDQWIQNKKAFFDSQDLPEFYQLPTGEKVFHVARFVDVHLARIKTYWQTNAARPYARRLAALQKALGNHGEKA